jgi:hypothetical protein
MDAGMSALIVAGVGVLGTLCSPILVQWVALRTKRQEFELQRQQSAEERVESRQLAAFEERRRVYGDLYAAARGYRDALKNHLRIVQTLGAEVAGRGEPDQPSPREVLYQVRLDWRERSSRAHMVLPEPVLDSATAVSTALAKGYGKVRRVETGDEQLLLKGADGGESIAEVYVYLNETLYDTILEMRAVMRADLGVATLERGEPDNAPTAA